MDLIYTDKNLNDLGVLQGYKADIAFGYEENNYAVQISFDYIQGKPPIEAGYFLYIEGTEYGGIVDTITIDTQEETITYEGRTWRGMLADKVIEPTADLTYKWNFVTVQGEANTAIQTLINLTSLGDIFAVPLENREGYMWIVDSGIDLDPYQFRYDVFLTSVMDMLYKSNAKLMIRYNSKRKRCLLSAEPLVNYSALEDVDSSQTEIYMSKSFNRVNHVICVGRWHFEDRYIIHVFSDGEGTVQPYLQDISKEPIEDSDYILNKSRQVLFGKDEVIQLLDNEDVEDVENYKLLTSQPDDWKKHYTNYYQLDEDTSHGDSFVQIEENIEDVYTLLDEVDEQGNPVKPPGWDSGAIEYYRYDTENEKYVALRIDETERPRRIYDKPDGWELKSKKKGYQHYYYYNSQTDKYEQIQGVDDYSTVISKEPSNWHKKYGDYYYWTGSQYSAVSGVSKTRYKIVTKKPDDWESSWQNFYVNSKGKYKRITEVSPYKEMIKESSKTKAPSFSARKYYYTESYTVAPKFSTYGSVHKKITKAPLFSARDVYELYKKKINQYRYETETFYRYDGEQDLGIEFQQGVYYRKVFDHYANIVAEAVNILTEQIQDDTLELRYGDTDDMNYDVGDIVGGTENRTGIKVTQVVRKKIVNIENNVETITYEMGAVT